jgi:hypothetical protein
MVYADSIKHTKKGTKTMTQVMKYPLETRKYGYMFEEDYYQATAKKRVKHHSGGLLVARDKGEDVPRKISNMPPHTWVSFYHLAQTVGAIDNKKDKQQQIVYWFNKHGAPIHDQIRYEDIIKLFDLLEDLFEAREFGDTEEFLKLIEKEEDLILAFILDVEIDADGKIEPTFRTNTFNEAIIMDFLFSRGILKNWYICKECGVQFTWHRKKDYCTNKCKRSAAYERQKIKGRKK